MAEIELKVETTLPQLTAALDNIKFKHISYAASRAINESLKDAQLSVMAKMGNVFAHPTAFTINSTFISYSTKNNLSGALKFKDGSQGTPAGKYLMPEIEGGQRSRKSTEKTLEETLDVGRAFFVPGKNQKLDAKYSIPRSKLQDIVGYFQHYKIENAAAGSFFNSRRGTKREGVRYFAVGMKNQDSRTRHLTPGIYQVVGDNQGLQKVLQLIERPTYKAIFPVYDVAEKKFYSVFGENFSAALQNALATAKN